MGLELAQISFSFCSFECRDGPRRAVAGLEVGEHAAAGQGAVGVGRTSSVLGEQWAGVGFEEVAGREVGGVFLTGNSLQPLLAYALDVLEALRAQMAPQILSLGQREGHQGVAAKRTPFAAAYT